MLGSDNESKKEATNWLVERVSHLVTQEKPHKLLRLITLLSDYIPTTLGYLKCSNMEIKLRIKELYKAKNINV